MKGNFGDMYKFAINLWSTADLEAIQPGLYICCLVALVLCFWISKDLRSVKRQMEMVIQDVEKRLSESISLELKCMASKIPLRQASPSKPPGGIDQAQWSSEDEAEADELIPPLMQGCLLLPVPSNSKGPPSEPPGGIDLASRNVEDEVAVPYPLPMMQQSVDLTGPSDKGPPSEPPDGIDPVPQSVEEAESNFAVKFSMQGSADLPDLTGNQGSPSEPPSKIILAQRSVEDVAMEAAGDWNVLYSPVMQRSIDLFDPPNVQGTITIENEDVEPRPVRRIRLYGNVEVEPIKLYENEEPQPDSELDVHPAKPNRPAVLKIFRGLFCRHRSDRRKNSRRK